jgi:hypothetical protein
MIIDTTFFKKKYLENFFTKIYKIKSTSYHHKNIVRTTFKSFVNMHPGPHVIKKLSVNYGFFVIS